LPGVIELAGELNWPTGKPTAAFLRLVGRAASRTPDGTVVVAGGAELQAWRQLFDRAWPGMRVIAVAEADDDSATHARLAAVAPVDLIVQAADTSAIAQARLFRRLFMHLREKGEYLTPRLLPVSPAERQSARSAAPEPRNPLPNEDASVERPFVSDLWELVSAAQAARTRDFEEPGGPVSEFRDVRGLGRHLEQVHVFSKAIRIKNGRRTQAKLTELEADAVLAERTEVGREVAALEPVAFTAQAPYEHNLDDDPYFSSQMDAPKLTLREYHQPVCSRGGIVTSDGLILPETFRHHLYPRLLNIYVEESAPRFGYVRRDISSPEGLPGSYFHLDSEWPGHFGHTMTELLGRMWAWERARAEAPGVKCLMTLQHDRAPMRLAPFELDLLSTFGITADDVHVFDGVCQPETLYAATSMFSLPDYVHPQMADTWRRVGDHLAAQATAADRPKRIFCTRSATLKRACRNVAEVEALFEAHGFTVIRPEEHSLAEQVALFRAAEAVGGLAGSALFTLALCPEPKRVYTVAPTSYTARNEQLICAAWGHPLVSAWSRPEIDHPPGDWTQEAFGSSFSVDMAEEGTFLAEHLAELDALRT
jgi:capsular polysaccharide biosynthesis protein